MNVYVGLIKCLERSYARDESWKFGNGQDGLIGPEEPYLHLLKRWGIQSRHEVLQELAGATKLYYNEVRAGRTIRVNELEGG